MAAVIDIEESPLDQLFSDLRYDTVDTVVVNMTVESSRRKSDWRALSSVLGFSEKQVQLMQQDVRQRCKGRLLINVWEDLGKSSLRRLIYALKEANMGECLRVIKQDPDLEDVDFVQVLKDYEELKANKLIRKEFPRVLMPEFRAVFFPAGVRMEPPFAQDPRMEYDMKARSSECFDVRTNSSLPVWNPAPPVDQVLDGRSVFISYCPESGLTHRKFNNQLRRFAEFIQNQGYTLHFEPNCQAQVRTYGGPITWKEACIKKSKNILVVCTPEYFKEDSKATDNTGKSVSKIQVDSSLLRQLAYSRNNERIIPVILDSKKPTRNQIPMWLQPLVTHSWPSGESDLVLCLEGLPKYVLPKVDPSKRKVIKPIVINFSRARTHKC